MRSTNPVPLVGCHTAVWKRPKYVQRGLGWEWGWWVLIPASCSLPVFWLWLEFLDRKPRSPLGFVQGGDGVLVHFQTALLSTKTTRVQKETCPLGLVEALLPADEVSL